MFRSQNRNCLQKNTKSDPNREPTRAPKPPKWTLLDLTKHMVFTVRITHWADSGDLWEHIFSALLSGHCFLRFCCDFLRFGVPRGSPKCARSFPGECPKIDSVAKSLPGGPKAPKGCPEVAKCHQRRSQIDDLGAQKSLKWAESFVVSDENNATTGHKKTRAFPPCLGRHFGVTFAGRVG